MQRIIPCTVYMVLCADTKENIYFSVGLVFMNVSLELSSALAIN